MRAGLVTWLVLIHATAIFLFSRGFLLSRLALSDVAQQHNESSSPPSPHTTHQRAVILIVDSLRFDFLSPDPPEPVNPYHHHVLTLPAELTKLHPGHSFLFNAYADPPTTTLQRIKALTTGSLPTFVDMGSNFGGSAILEDSIVKQLVLANKSIAFMGDDTWLSVFPSSFHPNLTFPYDSFNVEDLHTVDLGVLTHLFPLLRNAHPSLPPSTFTKANQFDFLIGHFLGVDHVGHRVGPSHPSMFAKLKQIDTALRQVVSLLDEDTLLVVLGDHGMDRAGDHGGDGDLETSSGMWIYSKGKPLMDTHLRVQGEGVFSGLLKYTNFPGSKNRSRLVQQIDVLPTLSLLLGLPIPYNNLGSIIPELFWRRSHQTTSPNGLELENALEVNSAQIKRYLDTYRASSSGAELDNAWNMLQAAWTAISASATTITTSSSSLVEMKLVAMMNYNRTALSACRLIWAQFNPILMATGLALMIAAIITTWIIYLTLRANGTKWGVRFLLSSGGGESSSFTSQTWKMSAGAGVIGYAVLWVVGYVLGGDVGQVSPIEGAAFGAGMIGCTFASVYITAGGGGLTFAKLRSFITPSSLFAVLILVLHTLSFFSNSFTFWEDKVVLWLCASAMVPFMLRGFAAPGIFPSTSSSPPSSTSKSTEPSETTNTHTATPRRRPASGGILAKLGLTSLKGKILGFTFLFLICIRLMALVTVCREEQGAYCHVTFYATPPTATTAPLPATSSPSPVSSPLSNTSVDDSAPQPIAILTTSTTPPRWSLILSLPTALTLPFLVSRILKITKSNNGIAPVMVWGVVTPSLLASWAFWMLEWIESGGIQPDTYPFLLSAVEEVVRLRTVRSWLARLVVGWIGLAFVGWWLLPVCLDIQVKLRHSGREEETDGNENKGGERENQNAQVAVLGYANAYGAPYLLFYLLGFSLVYLCTPLPGQVVLGLSGVALVAYLEALDAVMDAKDIERAVGRALNLSTSTAGSREESDDDEPTTFLTTLPPVLLSFVAFYATGHQSTISSLQWKTGFVLSESVRYPWSVLSVVLNSAGPFLLLGCTGGALLGSWKRSPSSSPFSSSTTTNVAKPKIGLNSAGPDKDMTKDSDEELGQNVEHSVLLTTLLVQLYFLALLLGTSLSAAILRRHLMVWKVFAPRFMFAVVELGVVDLGMLIAWGVSGGGEYSMVERVVEKVGWVLGRVGIGPGKEKEE